MRTEIISRRKLFMRTYLEVQRKCSLQFRKHGKKVNALLCFHIYILSFIGLGLGLGLYYSIFFTLKYYYSIFELPSSISRIALGLKGAINKLFWFIHHESYITNITIHKSIIPGGDPGGCDPAV